MAIAGGVPEPRVLLMEGDVVNAGAAGKEPCTVFVSRRMLDHLDRDETQGMLGHLLASIANGDLRIASGVLTVLQTLGLFMTVMDVPFSVRAREALADLARYIFGAKDHGLFRFHRRNTCGRFSPRDRCLFCSSPADNMISFGICQASISKPDLTPAV